MPSQTQVPGGSGREGEGREGAVGGGCPWCQLWCAHVFQAKALLLQRPRKLEVAKNGCCVAQGCEFEQGLDLLHVEALWFGHHAGMWESGIRGSAPP